MAGYNNHLTAAHLDMKVREAEKGTGMTEAEAKEYLVKSRSNLILGTVDANGNPNMAPVWYYFDPQAEKIYMYTYRKAAKASNLHVRDVVYFDVDDDRFPDRGVRGRGRAKEVLAKAMALEILGKILARYIKPGNPFNSIYIGGLEKGAIMVVGLTPAYLTTWDVGKGSPEQVRAYGDALLPWEREDQKT